MAYFSVARRAAAGAVALEKPPPHSRDIRRMMRMIAFRRPRAAR